MGTTALKQSGKIIFIGNSDEWNGSYTENTEHGQVLPVSLQMAAIRIAHCALRNT
jgi:hypothetical protein